MSLNMPEITSTPESSESIKRMLSDQRERESQLELRKDIRALTLEIRKLRTQKSGQPVCPAEMQAQFNEIRESMEKAVVTLDLVYEEIRKDIRRDPMTSRSKLERLDERIAKIRKILVTAQIQAERIKEQPE